MENIKRLLSCLLFLVSTALSASDLEKEMRWQAEVAAGLFDGEAIMLDTGELGFMGIWMHAPNDIAVILMHGTGAHPDWPQVINPLRVGLAEQGWSSLSIQMPVLGNEASMDEYLTLYDEVPPRIEAALDFLKQAGYARVVLLGHSQGSRMAAYYLAGFEHGVAGFIAIGMPDAPLYLEKIDIPVLDIYAQFDFESILVLRSASQTAAAHNSDYSQAQIDEADHFHEGYEDQLLEQIVVWLNKQGG